jgi:hypothetical protein
LVTVDCVSIDDWCSQSCSELILFPIIIHYVRLQRCFSFVFVDGAAKSKRVECYHRKIRTAWMTFRAKILFPFPQKVESRCSIKQMPEQPRDHGTTKWSASKQRVFCHS